MLHPALLLVTPSRRPHPAMAAATSLPVPTCGTIPLMRRSTIALAADSFGLVLVANPPRHPPTTRAVAQSKSLGSRDLSPRGGKGSLTAHKKISSHCTPMASAIFLHRGLAAPGISDVPHHSGQKDPEPVPHGGAGETDQRDRDTRTGNATTDAHLCGGVGNHMPTSAWAAECRRLGAQVASTDRPPYHHCPDDDHAVDALGKEVCAIEYSVAKHRRPSQVRLSHRGCFDGWTIPRRACLANRGRDESATRATTPDQVRQPRLRTTLPRWQGSPIDVVRSALLSCRSPPCAAYTADVGRPTAAPA